MTIEIEYDALLTQVMDSFTSNGLTIDNKIYAFARSVAYLLQYRNSQIIATLDQQSINNAVGEWLDNIGVIRGITRISGETDDAYRTRLKVPITQVSTLGYYSRRLKEQYPTDDIKFLQEVGTTPPNVVLYVGKADKTAIASPTIDTYEAYVQSDGVRIVNDEITVSNLTYVTVNVVATVYVLPASTLNAAYFEDLIENYLDVQVVPGQDITRNKLIAILGGDETVANVTIDTPATDTTINNGQLAKKGTITINVTAAT